MFQLIPSFRVCVWIAYIFNSSGSLKKGSWSRDVMEPFDYKWFATSVDEMMMQVTDRRLLIQLLDATRLLRDSRIANLVWVTLFASSFLSFFPTSSLTCDCIKWPNSPPAQQPATARDGNWKTPALLDIGLVWKPTGARANGSCVGESTIETWPSNNGYDCLMVMFELDVYFWSLWSYDRFLKLNNMCSRIKHAFFKTQIVVSTLHIYMRI